MNTNNLSKETEAKLIDFFSNTIDPSCMAKAIRQLNYLIALSIIREEETGTIYSQRESIEKGYYWLNELAEILNPYLDAK